MTQDTKVSGFTESTSVLYTDAVPFIYDPSGTPRTRRAQANNFFAGPEIKVAASDAPDNWKKHADKVCTGADDDVKIQEAIDALPSTGGKVELSPGTFSLSDSVIDDGGSDITIAGQDFSTIVKAAAAMTTTMFVLSGTRTILKDMTLDGNQTARGALTSIYTVKINGSTDLVIDSCALNDDTWEAVRCTSSCTRPRIVNCIGSDSYGGFVVLTGASYATVSGNRFVTNASDSMINLKTGCLKCVISGNVLTGGEGGGIGVATGGAGHVISNNQVYDDASIGITVNCGDCSVQGNHVENCDGSGIWIAGDGDRCTVTGNNVVNCGLDISETYNDGITVNGSNVTVSNNTVSLSGRANIAAISGIGVIISYNLLVDCAQLETGRHIWLITSGSDAIIEGNICSDAGAANQDYAIVVANGWSYVRIAHNNLRNTGTADKISLGSGAAITAFANEGYAEPIVTFAADDATPSVLSKSFFKTANANPTTITTFDDGVVGQRITVIVNDNNTTFDFSGTTLKCNRGIDFIAATGDIIEAVYDGTNWYVTSMDRTA